MVVDVWDEIGEVWSSFDLDLPDDCRDPELINLAVGNKVAESEDGDGWDVVSYSQAGPLLIIETRSDRNHLAVIVVGHKSSRLA